MAIGIPLQLAEEMTPVTREFCLDFIRFRNAIKAHRTKCDDNIKQRVASITNPPLQCPKFADNLKKAHMSRIKNLKSCIKVLENEAVTSSKVIQKEVQKY